MPWKTIGEVGDCSFHPAHDVMLGDNAGASVASDQEIINSIKVYCIRTGNYPGFAESIWRVAKYSTLTVLWGIPTFMGGAPVTGYDYIRNAGGQLSSYVDVFNYMKSGDADSASIAIFNNAVDYMIKSKDENFVTTTILKGSLELASTEPVKIRLVDMITKISRFSDIPVDKIKEVVDAKDTAKPWTTLNVLGFLAIGYATYRIIGYTRDQWYGRKIRKLAEEEEDLVEEIRESAFERDEARKKRERLEKKRSRNWLFPDVVHDKSVVKSETEQPRRFPGVVQAASSISNVLAAEEAKNRAFSEAVRETERVAPGKIIKSKGGRIDDKTKELYEGVAKELNKKLEVQHGKGVKIPTDPSSKEFEKMKGALSRGMKI